MPAAYARTSKIGNASGRSDYITDKKRQEEIVLQRSLMIYDWSIHAQFEKEHEKNGKANNEALEVHFKLPNELSEKPEELEVICDTIAQRITGSPNRDYEYAVHWNHARTNLHCHVLFSERENQTELVPKIYKRDIWYNHETQRIARAGSPGAELIHRKGEVQRDADGNIKYESDLFKAKDRRFNSRGFVHEIRQICQEVMNEHGFEYENTTKDSPYLPQRKLYKGASEDYLAAARAYNNAVKEYNELIREGFNTRKPEHDMLVDLTALKSVTLDHVKRANHDARRITVRSVEEILKSVHNVLLDMFTTQMTVTVPSQNIVAAYDGAYALQLGDGYVFFQPHELRRSENGVEIMLEKDAIYSVTSYDGREPYSAKELMDIIQADLERSQQRQTQRQRQFDDDFEL